MHITYKFRVKDKHRATLNKQARSVNFVWNFCNDTQKHALKWGKRWPSGYDLQKLVTGSAKELGILATTLNRVCERYERSRRQFNRPFIRFRGRKNLGWIPFRGRDVKITDGGFRFNKENYNVWLSRPIPEGAKICDGSNFSQDATGRWYINLVIDVPEAARRETSRQVGIDLGLKDLAVLSTGEAIAAPRYYRTTQERLAKAQRAKKKRQVAKIQVKIAAQRRDHLHKVSTRIVRDFDKIVVGDVSASGLAKTNLAKSVNDAGWSMLRNQLRYKAIAHGAEYIEVSEKFTTQTCSECGSVSGPKGQKGLGIRQWSCAVCGSVHDRDTNAAMNIVRRGQATLVEGIAA